MWHNRVEMAGEVWKVDGERWEMAGEGWGVAAKVLEVDGER